MASDGISRGKGWGDDRYKAVIQLLVAERKRQKLSQASLATKLKRHQQFVSRYETGERRLDIVEFVDVASALGLTPAAMIGEIEPARLV